jgi:aspartyl-tRNA(Asn)/glutamyl-tRNA(Gln) amidotransferase subunit B
MPTYIPVIGMEIHAELATQSKMFCRCENGYALRDKPNDNVCMVCLGHPGALPVANREAINWTIKVGLALNCEIARVSKFDRKNYFYPDLPKGYQISQYDQPLTYQGKLLVGKREIGIIRIHLEEDTGKLIHEKSATKVDLSRSGTPLIELVTEPTITSAQEAKEFCQLYQTILRYLGVSDADMEKGQMRCEANVSVQEAGRFEIDGPEVRPLLDYQLNPKSELKNINSFRAMERAVEYEIKRQTAAIEAGEPLVQETRGWDEAKQKTVSQRIKETAADYRYFPEPDIPPLAFTDEEIKELMATLPELPQAKYERFIAQYRFSPEDAQALANDKYLAAYAENVVSELITWLDSLPNTESTAEEILEREGPKLAKLVGNWLINRLAAHLNGANTSMRDCPITPENFAEFLTLIHQNKVTNLAAQELLEKMYTEGGNPLELLEKHGFGQIDNTEEIEAIVKQVIAENPQIVAEIAAGKAAGRQFLMGQVMRATKGRANPQLINELLDAHLNVPTE